MLVLLLSLLMVRVGIGREWKGGDCLPRLDLGGRGDRHVAVICSRVSDRAGFILSGRMEDQVFTHPVLCAIDDDDDDDDEESSVLIISFVLPDTTTIASPLRPLRLRPLRLPATTKPRRRVIISGVANLKRRSQAFYASSSSSSSS